MCLFYMQLLEIREDYFPTMDKALLRRFYDSFDVKEMRGENYLVDELLKWRGGV